MRVLQSLVTLFIILFLWGTILAAPNWWVPTFQTLSIWLPFIR